MTKDRILEEIRRTATANGGVPLGLQTFLAETGIQRSDWYGKYWARWGDAVEEAGFTPNRLTSATPQDHLLGKLIGLIRKIGRFPVVGEIRMYSRTDKDFPNYDTFRRRLGGKREILSLLEEYFSRHEGFDDVVSICSAEAAAKEDIEDAGMSSPANFGYVYLVKHGSRREYKIGKTCNPLRREGEIALQLPEKLTPIHYIQTDDPSGIEKYWHSRFSDKRKEGEWFALLPKDVQAFKRWKRIY